MYDDDLLLDPGPRSSTTTTLCLRLFKVDNQLFRQQQKGTPCITTYLSLSVSVRLATGAKKLKNWTKNINTAAVMSYVFEE